MAQYNVCFLEKNLVRLFDQLLLAGILILSAWSYMHELARVFGCFPVGF
jgi:hypothetical protein